MYKRQPLPTWDELEAQLSDILPLTAPDSTLMLLLNKRDLLTESEVMDWLSHCFSLLQRTKGKPHTTSPLAISARAAQGIEALEELMVDVYKRQARRWLSSSLSRRT